MATITNNALLKGLSGTLGDFCFRVIRGKTYVSKRPKARSGHSPLQQKAMNRFRHATQYAKKQMNDWEIRQLYQTGVNEKKRSAYHVALSDALNAPEIHYVHTSQYSGAAGNLITIKATDDFKVVRVRVIITDGHGNHVECGEAIRSIRKPDFWKYKAMEFNGHVPGTTVTVTAFDIPENETTSEVIVGGNH